MDIVTLIIICVKALVVFAAIMLTVMAMTLAERRISAFMQNRLGPNRVGPKGLLQPLADGIKFLMKEDVIPSGVDKPIFLLAPVMLIVPALMTFAIIPFGSELHFLGGRSSFRWQISILASSISWRSQASAFTVSYWRGGLPTANTLFSAA